MEYLNKYITNFSNEEMADFLKNTILKSPKDYCICYANLKMKDSMEIFNKVKKKILSDFRIKFFQT